MCNNCGKNSGVSSQTFNISETLNSSSRFPEFFETVAAGDDISRDPESNSNMLLDSGQYRVKFKTDITEEKHLEAFTLKNFQVDVPYENEFKRVQIFKMDSVPLSDSERLVTVKFALVDNPVWLAPVLWTLPAVGSWFVVDKVERFTEKSPISFGLIMLTAIGALGVFALK